MAWEDSERLQEHNWTRTLPCKRNRSIAQQSCRRIATAFQPLGILRSIRNTFALIDEDSPPFPHDISLLRRQADQSSQVPVVVIRATIVARSRVGEGSSLEECARDTAAPLVHHVLSFVLCLLTVLLSYPLVKCGERARRQLLQ